MSILLRPAKPSDSSFVLDAWLRTYQKSLFVRAIHPKTYWSQHGELVRQVLSKPSTVITIAYPEEDQDTDLGFIVWEPGIVHYVYIKASHRDLYGIAELLLNSTGMDSFVYTQRTDDIEGITRKWAENNCIRSGVCDHCQKRLHTSFEGETVIYSCDCKRSIVRSNQEVPRCPDAQYNPYLLWSR